MRSYTFYTLAVLAFLWSASPLFGQFYLVTLYNTRNEAQLTTQPLKFKTSKDCLLNSGRYLVNNSLTGTTFFMLDGPFDSETSLANERQRKQETLAANGFNVQAFDLPLSKTPADPGIAPRRLDFGRLPASQTSSEKTASTTAGMAGYLTSNGDRLKVRIYSETVTSGKGMLLYEGWVDKGGLVKITSERGRIAYCYKSHENDPWSGLTYTGCTGGINQAVSIP